jgi:hypothetical protein
MVEDDERRLWTTTSGIALALGVTVRAIYNLYSRNTRHFEEVTHSVTLHQQVLNFIKDRGAHFGVKHFRHDLRIWSEDDVLTFAVLCRSPQGIAAKRDFLRFIKENMRRDYAKLEAQYAEVMQRLVALEEAVPSIRKSASAAGSALAAHRGTTALRDLN